MKAEKLILISEKYPFGSSETFLENEIKILSRLFDQIHIFPLFKEKKIRELPKNVFLNTGICTPQTNQNRKINIPERILIYNFLLKEFINTKQKRFFISKIRWFANLLKNSKKEANILEKQLRNISGSLMFYSYWMNSGTSILTFLKQKNIINEFIFRVHGFDLYEDRHPGNYMPFRYTNMKFCKNVYTISKQSKNHLESKNIYPAKVKLAYLGTFDVGINKLSENNIFTIVSCSSIIALKRIDLIIEILKKTSSKIKWIHLGDGQKMQEITKQAKKLPPNINWKLKGNLSYDKVLEFYKNTEINLFVNVSETEGLPVSIMEAISFGIPVIATDVGGTSEIVNEKTGILIPKDFYPHPRNSKSKIINNFPDSEYNTPKFRKGVRKFWEENFEAEKNYTEFYDEIIQ